MVRYRRLGPSKLGNGARAPHDGRFVLGACIVALAMVHARGVAIRFLAASRSAIRTPAMVWYRLGSVSLRGPYCPHSCSSSRYYWSGGFESPQGGGVFRFRTVGWFSCGQGIQAESKCPFQTFGCVLPTPRWNVSIPPFPRRMGTEWAPGSVSRWGVPLFQFEYLTAGLVSGSPHLGLGTYSWATLKWVFRASGVVPALTVPATI